MKALVRAVYRSGERQEILALTSATIANQHQLEAGDTVVGLHASFFSSRVPLGGRCEGEEGFGELAEQSGRPATSDRGGGGPRGTLALAAGECTTRHSQS